MAYNVEDFLAENVKSKVETKNVKFDGFKSPFVIKALTADEFSELQKQATTSYINKKTHQRVQESDQNKLVDLMMSKAVIQPDLNDEKLQKSWGCIADPAGVLKKMLNAGQYTDLGNAIQELSGFDIDSIDNFVEQAKN
ncbi:hypothetical protein [Lactobacillus sp. M0390]|uniref:phage tail assembly chaperone n=1 Tax=Lactobacillus sp. M0390 TaxID=2751026 RepID=UPI0018DBE89C|nr:hypothetical protein [Lactobacillus sp. M0390]MBH9985207.1 hypothetical protein [Lactobacillus sp. M0390]